MLRQGTPREPDRAVAATRRSGWRTELRAGAAAELPNVNRSKIIELLLVAERDYRRKRPEHDVDAKLLIRFTHGGGFGGLTGLDGAARKHLVSTPVAHPLD